MRDRIDFARGCGYVALILTALLPLESVYAKRPPGFWRVFREACIAELPRTYPYIKVDGNRFCDCLGRGFVQHMTIDKRRLLEANEQRAGTHLRFKDQLYEQGFGNIHFSVAGSCESNVHAFK